MKILIVLISILLQISFSPVMAGEEKVKGSEDPLANILETFSTSVLQPVIDSIYIVIDNKNTVYLHDSSTFVGLMFDRSKRVSFEEMDNRVKEFTKKKGGPNLHSVFLVVAENVPFKYLYEVIRHYEKAVYNSTGSNIVEYRFTSPLTPKIIKERIEENKKYPIHLDSGK